jgi:hypothetical protein
MSKSKLRQQGFSNQTALTLIGLLYPLGFIALASIYSGRIQNISSLNIPIITTESAKTLEDRSQERISEQEAKAAIRAWWGVRPKIFASPYDAAAANEFVADGPLWTDLNKSDGPVAWLKNNNQYYTYESTSIENVISFQPEDTENPSITVTVTSEHTLNGSGVYKPSSNTSNFKYIFAKEGGRWKIWNYEKV